MNIKKNTVVLLGGIIALAGLAEAQTIATIKISFATTKGVRDSVGGTSNSSSLLNTKYNYMRNVEARSVGNINWQRSTHYSASYNDQNQTAQTQLTRLRVRSNLSGFRSYRDSTNGDLGQLFCDWTNGGILGVANQPGWASVCRRNVLTVNSGTSATRLTSTHEFGHNMNASHGHGFCINGLNQRTVMEPNTGNCSSYIRTGYFSALSRTRLGERLGNNSNKNRERIRDRAPTTARQQ